MTKEQVTVAAPTRGAGAWSLDGRLRGALRRLANSAASACASGTPERTRTALKALSAEVERADKLLNATKPPIAEVSRRES